MEQNTFTNYDPRDLRLVSFVAGLYLNELQKGLQTAHVVSEMYAMNLGKVEEHNLYFNWATKGKTIIILNAGNHAGVVEAGAKLQELIAPFGLPFALFNEDEQSMNGMATACGIVLPPSLWQVKKEKKTIDVGGEEQVVTVYLHEEQDGTTIRYHRYAPGSDEHALIEFISGYRLA